MGVTMVMRMIDPDVANQIADSPEMANDILLPKGEVLSPRPQPQPLPKSRGFFSLFRKKEPMPPSQPPIRGVDWNQVYGVEDVLDLDKTGEALHYLLTNGAMPFERVTENWWICPGDEHYVGSDEELIVLIPADQVAPFLNAVESMDEPVMRARFNPEKMCEMPIGIIEWTDDPEGNFQYLLEYRNKLVEFLQKAHAQNKALLSGVVL